ncbi:hypothetical protein BFL36_05870 [Clavibacter michiganensis]|uniref:Uncharacterized protein n=1 Tax=Clavibacter michiganensis TaxID=28447 RepID=A0A251YK15_9MICO|nr:hypothetical protein [Clavibacter michiganensis]OUE24596.1 hypothetical protein BFL36_05870 [Clavibacter michiganensis]
MSAGDDGWVVIPAPTSRQRIAIGLFWMSLAGGVFLNVWLGLGRLVEEAVGGGWLTVAGTIVVIEAAVIGSVYALMVRRTPALEIDVARGVMRIRGAELPLTDLTGASVEAMQSSPMARPPWKGAPLPESVVLALTTKQGARCRIVLLVGERRIQSAEATAALVAAVRASAITPPTTPDDPDGRFTRVNFPGALDVDDAVELIEEPERRRHVGF